ncbi:MAG: CbiX/SirB N-terminal domain-containing protein [Tumebacillaceae bacterium]
MNTAILVVAHGSPVAKANEDLFYLVEQVRERSGCEIVEAAFLERARPSIPEGIDACVRRGAGRVVVLPFFLLLGAHVVEDLPRLVDEARDRHPGVEFVLGRHLGDDERVALAVLQRIREAERGF